MSKTLPCLVAVACAALLAAGCGKPVETGATRTKVASTSAPPAPTPLTPKPRGSLEAALATGPGVVGDTSQTAALSAPANPNGTTPSRGVIPRPSR